MSVGSSVKNVPKIYFVDFSLLSGLENFIRHRLRTRLTICKIYPVNPTSLFLFVSLRSVVLLVNAPTKSLGPFCSTSEPDPTTVTITGSGAQLIGSLKLFSLFISVTKIFKT